MRTTIRISLAALALAAVLAALGFAFRAIVRRRRRRLAQLLARARDEGRAEARRSTLVGAPPRKHRHR
jgi:flagellar biosynthesis/type III secretory pathway M-ring protein FliF/YscJ